MHGKESETDEEEQGTEERRETEIAHGGTQLETAPADWLIARPQE